MVDVALFRLPGARVCALGCALLALLSAGLIALQAFSLSFAIVSVWEGAMAFSTVGPVIVFILCFAGNRAILELQDAVACRFADRVEEAFATELGSGLLEEGKAILSVIGGPGAATLLVEGTAQIRAYAAIAIRKLVNMVVIPLVLVVAIFGLDWISGIIALVCYPFIIVFMVLIGRGAKEEADRTHGGFVSMANHYMDSVKGLRTLKSFGRSRAQADKVFASSEAYRMLTMRTLRVGTLSSTVLDIFATCGLAAVAIMLGFRLVEGTVAFWPALAVLMLVPEYFRPIKAYARDYHATLEGKASMTSAQEALGRVQAAKERTAELISQETASMTVGPFEELAFEDVSFSYAEGDEPALADVRFSLHSGEVLGVVGPSGAGKSTLLDIVAGLANPSEGLIRLNGHGCRTLHREEWRSQVCYLPQSPLILSASLRDNLSLYAPGATDGEMRAALDAIGLHHLIQDREGGLDLPLGEGGLQLSGGEAQRLCVARALLDDDRRVWILDEPTARLDAETERSLIEAITGAAVGRTLVVATHSSAWRPHLDRILKVEEGRVDAAG